MLKSRINPSHTYTTGFLTILLYCTPNESGIYITVLAIITINKPTMSNVNVFHEKSHRHVQTFPIHVIIFDHVHVSAFLLLQVLYLMDKFNASDTFYHELSTILPSTPRSYKIKKVRTEMNVHLRRKIHRVPEPHNGVYCSVNETLSDTIEELVYGGPVGRHLSAKQFLN